MRLPVDGTDFIDGRINIQIIAPSAIIPVRLKVPNARVQIGQTEICPSRNTQVFRVV